MRINTNVSALNTQRILGNSNAAVAKQIGRLSSGFRINSASDDAAGLGIANKLRAETRAMKQAGRNAEQANSMLQIMEGGANSIGSIVERMKELATQGASDNVSTSDRTKVIDEMTQLQIGDRPHRRHDEVPGRQPAERLRSDGSRHRKCCHGH